MANSFLINYLINQNDPNVFLESTDHLQLFNTNLNFYYRHISSDEGFYVDLAAFIRQLFIIIVNKSELNQHEIEFIMIFCKYYCRFSKFDQIQSLVLENEHIDQELKIEIVQCLIEKNLIEKSYDVFIIEFVFRSLNTLFDDFHNFHQHHQQATKQVNNILWILFNTDHVDRLIEGIYLFFNSKILLSSIDQDDQLVELILDFLACLLRFTVSADHKLQSIKSSIQTVRIKEIVLNSTLNINNSAIRKKARYLCDQIGLLPLVVIEVLETLEEKQIHLIQPVIDKKLNLPSFQTELNATEFNTVLELIIKRMFDHDCKSVKLYAFRIIEDQQNFISNSFILNQVITTLQQNLIYDADFIDRPLNCLNRISIEQILTSLLDKEADGLSSFSLFFILKQKFLNTSYDKAPLPDKFTIQRIMGLGRMIGDRPIKHTITIYMIKILIRHISPDTNGLIFLCNVLYCLNTKEIRAHKVITASEIVSLNRKIQLDELELTNDNCILIGFARYCGIVYSHEASQLDLFNATLNKLQQTDHYKTFLLNFLQILVEINQELWQTLKIDAIKDKQILALICSKKIDSITMHEICDTLRQKIESSIETKDKLCYLAMNNNLHEELDHLFRNDHHIEIDITDEKHWKLLNNHLTRYNMEVDRAIKIVNHKAIESDESKIDLLLNLISKTPAETNTHVIEFLGNIFESELKNDVLLDQTLILKHFFAFTDLLFKSCLEIRKVGFYIKMFRMLIERIAFPSVLFHPSNSMLFFSDTNNLDQLSSLYQKIFELNTLEIRSILINHLSQLIADDPLLVNHKLFGEFLIDNMVNACLLDRKFQILIDHLKDQISNDPFISGCLNLNLLNLDNHRETRIKSIFTCLRLDLNTLIRLINKMMEHEQKIDLRKQKNFPNSTYHRKQVKIWQFMLMVTLKMLKLIKNDNSARVETMLRLIYHLTISSIVKQSSTQPSVRLLQQIIVIVLIKDEKCPDEFYEKFKQLLSVNSTSDYLSDLSRNQEDDIIKIGYITSLLSIVFHLIKSKPDLKYYPIFYLINCNHYKTRLFSHLVLVENGVKVDLPITASQTKQINTMPKSVSGSNNIVKNFELLRKDWFFAAFDSEKDINLHFIFNLLPKLTNLFNDDLIELSLLAKHHEPNVIELQNNSTRLIDVSYTDYSRHSKICEFENCDSNNRQKEIFQKKYTGPQLDVQAIHSNAKPRLSELILCASLIDRSPNLGGLARTSEIFAIRKLIIPNNKVLKEKEFQSLSVSAEKWIDTEECFPWDLMAYLRVLKRDHNYTLIALEQSTKSICLTKFEFPAKSLILLGNERQGLPIELLSMVDYVVEIPQSGIIKSLNVHISAALCVFEYYKQHNLKFNQ